MTPLEQTISSLYYSYLWIHLTVGIIQPIGAFLRILLAKRRSSPYAIGLKIYLTAVVAYFLIMTILLNNLDIKIIASLYWIYLIIVPLCYATWYIRHILKWRQKHRNIADYNKLHFN
jgi:hypothetical protein